MTDLTSSHATGGSASIAPIDPPLLALLALLLLAIALLGAGQRLAASA